MTNMSLDVIKEEILHGMRILQGEGILVENRGHLSYRLDNGNIVIIGHLHDNAKTFEEMTIEDFVIIDPQGKLVEGNLRPVGERYIHTAIYARLPEIRSVLHAHPEKSMVFGIANTPIIPVYHQATIFAPAVRMFDYSGQIDKPELGEQVAEAIGDDYAMLLRGHGTVVAAANIRETVVVALMLEITAELQWKASVLGNPLPVRTDEMEGRHAKGQTHANYMKNLWRYFSNKCISGKYTFN